MQEILFDESQFCAAIPHRKPESDKNDYGRVLAVCGSPGYTGAAFFAAQAAVRTGSGIVTLAVPDEIYSVLAVKLNEPVIRAYHRAQAADTVCTWAQRADAILVGCGIGHEYFAEKMTLDLLSSAACRVVVDADGINALCGHIDVLRQTAAPAILTPHAAEFSRLAGISDPTAEDASRFACENRCIVVLKGHRTVIATPDGTVFRNTTGNAGMAKGGSGDVLAGCILSLLGQGLDPVTAACAGCYLHGSAGDICAEEKGQYGMTPTDMLLKIAEVLQAF